MSLSEQRRRARSSPVLRIVGGTEFIGCEPISVQPRQSRSLRAKGPVAGMLFTALGWIAAELLTACAQYAEGLFLIPMAGQDAADITEPVEPPYPGGAA
jgi:hypothetical protein